MSKINARLKSPLISSASLKQIALKLPGFLAQPTSLKSEAYKVAIKALEEVAGQNTSELLSLSGLSQRAASLVLEKSQTKKQTPANLKRLSQIIETAGQIVSNLQ